MFSPTVLVEAKSVWLMYGVANPMSVFAEAPSGLIVKLILLNEKALVDPNAFILSYVTR